MQLLNLSGNGTPASQMRLFGTYENSSDLKKYKNTSSTVKAILDDFIKHYGRKPAVIAFGEIHAQDGYSKVTTDYFAENIIPVLAAAGYKDLVWEFLPYNGGTQDDMNSYKIMLEEIERLDINKDRVFDEKFKDKFPKLYCALYSCESPQPLLKIILSAKRRGINIHGGGLTFSQTAKLEKALKSGNSKTIKNTWEDTTNIIGKNSYKAIETLLRRGKRVLSYGGAAHNDIKPASLTFGYDLAKEYGLKNYLEVDLIVPELLSKRKFITEKTDEYDEYALLSSANGIIRYSKSKNGEVIVFKDPELIRRAELLEKIRKENRQARIKARKKLLKNKAKNIFEMPAIRALKKYDKNSDKKLSPDEIRSMKDGDAASLFYYAVKENKVSFYDALNILIKLPSDKIGKILTNIKACDDYDLRTFYFNKIAEKSINKAAEIILSIKEPRSKRDERGLRASVLMEELSPQLKNAVTQKIRINDPDYARNIEAWAEFIENGF